MKILTLDYNHGIIEFIPETSGDLYAIYRILKPGDLLRAETSRRIRRNDEFGRADTGERVKMTLEIEVEEFAFGGFGDTLRVKGIIVAGNEDLISLGSYHTIALSTMEKARLTKNEWNASEKQIIEEAKEDSMRSQILIVTLDEGTACIALVTPFQVKIITEVSSAITRKFSDTKQHSTTKGNFFKEAHQIIKDTTDQYEPEVIIVAGPGFTAEEFLDFVKKRDQSLLEIIQHVHAHTGGKVGLHEVLSRKLPEKIAKKQRVVFETQLLEEFYRRIGKETDTATYGVDSVKKAIQMGAVETLMISDDMLQVLDIEKRALIDELVEETKQKGGKTVFMSIMHETGEKLSELGGVAALLRFPLPTI